jgi:glycerophosphoryl diester phosphodiesterase
LKESIEISKTRGIKTISYFIIWNLGITVVIFIVYAFIMGLTILFVTGLSDRTLAIATFITFNDSINGYLILIFYTLSTAGNLALITNMYYTYNLEKHNVSKTMEDVIYIREYSYKRIVSIAVVALALVNLYFFFVDIRNGSPLDYMNIDKIQVTSHRGFSHDVPENTLPAIEKAIEEQADYVEVDVRVTKDGELVLLHDNSLKRTAGVNKKIWDLTYNEVFGLDAGSWLSDEFKGTKIPTLREVLELSKGKVMLNLDLKYRAEEDALAQKVVDLIKEYEMEWQCVVTSTSLKCLEQVKELNPDIRTGFITYQIYSGLYENEAVDFFSMKYNLVSKGVVRQVHKNGKEIHVWTVNSKTEFERLERIGVDNIITDNPAYAKQVLYQESELFFVTLLKIMME